MEKPPNEEEINKHWKSLHNRRGADYGDEGYKRCLWGKLVELVR